MIMWDAPEVTRYGEAFGVTLSKMTVNVLQDDIIKYSKFCFCITICFVINSFQRPLFSHILSLKGGALKM